MNKEQIQHMVNRFLQWKLPANFNPDGGIKFEQLYSPTGHKYSGPFGTNLFDATQAAEMVAFMIEGMPAAEREPATTAEFIVKTVQEAFNIVPRNAPPISEQVAKAALSALRGLYDEVAEISQRNNLGAMNNSTMKAARKELGLPTEWTEAQREYPVSVPVKQRRIIHIVFQQVQLTGGKPDLAFIDVHNEACESINAGEWAADSDGYEALIIDLDNVSLSHVPPPQKPAAPDPVGDALAKLFAPGELGPEAVLPRRIAEQLAEQMPNKGGLTGKASLTVTPTREHRQTFEVPPGHVALRDSDGRATGETVKIETYCDISHEFEPDPHMPEWCAGCGYNKSARVHRSPFGRKLVNDPGMPGEARFQKQVNPAVGSTNIKPAAADFDKPHEFEQSPLAGYCKCGREKASPTHNPDLRQNGGG